MGVKIPARFDGTLAADGNPITNPPNKYNNGFEGTTIQAPTAFKVLDQITVSGGDDAVMMYDSIVSTKGKWLVTTQDLQWDGANWVFDNGTETWTHLTATGAFPDKTGWPLGSLGSDAIVLSYSSYYIENEEFVARSYADDLARINLAQKVVDQWEQVNGVCLIRERATYSQSLVETLAWYNGAVRWAEKYTSSCGGGVAPFLENYIAEGGDNYISEGGDNYIGD